MKLTADPRISLLMVAVWAVAPTSTVLEMLYAEALFCALAVWALIALVDRRWLTAAGLTIAAGTVRSTAVALVAAVVVAAAAALVEAARTQRRIAGWWRPLAAALLAPLGLLGFLAYVAVRTAGWTGGSGSRTTPSTWPSTGEPARCAAEAHLPGRGRRAGVLVALAVVAGARSWYGA